MRTEAMYVHPSSMVQVLRADQQTSPLVAIAELIDNALDASATQITVTIDGDSLRCLDNGRGCPDMKRLIDIQRVELPDNRIGRYGWGGKYTAVLMAHSMHAGSVCDGVLRRVEIDYDDPSLTARYADELNTGQPSFMDIRLLRLHKYPKPATLVRDIERRYCSALGQYKKRIIVNGERVRPLSFPKLEMALGLQFPRHFNGLEYQIIDFGAIKKGADSEVVKRWRSGWHVTYHGRLLYERGIVSGFRDYEDPNVWGLIELRDTADMRWSVDPRKVSFAECDALLDSLYPRIVEILAYAQQQAQDSQLQQVARDASSLLMGKRVPVEAKAKRTKTRAKKGSVQPTGTGAKQKQASNAVEFPNRNLLGPSGQPINVRFTDELDDDILSEVVTERRRILVRLNSTAPFFAQAGRTDPVSVALVAAQAIAYEAVMGERGILDLLPFVDEGTQGQLFHHPRAIAGVFRKLADQIAVALTHDREIAVRKA